MNIAVLLSTYNGERFLSQQLDSIINQTYSDFKIHIRDDGSSDNTPNIIGKYVEDYPNKIIWYENTEGNLGIASSFRYLVSLVDADCYFFADQDDIWMLDKIERQTNFYIENKIGTTATLVFSNMVVFNHDTDSEYDYFNSFNLSQDNINRGILKGVVSGCVMMFDRKLRDIYLERLKNDYVIHDYNMYMSAYLFGEILVMPEKLIKHRIHGANSIGDRKTSRINILFKDGIKFFLNNKGYRTIVFSHYFQYVDVLASLVDNNIRYKKKLYNSEEVDKMCFLKRKIWFYRHFLVVETSFIRFVKLLTL